MAPGSVPPTSSCPLLELVPHLRLRIYAYTHQLSPDLDIDEECCETFSKAWESKPLVKLASTCRLIADEARHYFRSLPITTTLQQRALVELLPTGGPRSYVKLRLVHLPCPTIDLTHFTATYDFAKYRSTAHGFPLADRDDALEATRNMGFHVSSALRRLMSLSNATKLMRCILLIGGLGPTKDGEPYFDAMQRILYQPNAGPASAETLAQEIFSCCCEDAAMLRVTSDLRLPVFKGCLLCLLVIGK